jgi:HTH-type transcriptional regulator / antitoxin HigA
MESTEPLTYQPDYAIPAGATLRSTLAQLEMSQADLAARTGLSLKHINQVVQGVAPLTPDTALLLEKATGVPARIWNVREALYRERKARAEDKEFLATDSAWLKQLPVKELIRRGVLMPNNDPGVMLEQLCRFFGVANREAWERVWREPLASFRKSPKFTTDAGAVAAWLRLGEMKAKKPGEPAPYDARKFREMLHQIRSLSASSSRDLFEQVVGLCAAAGVVVVFVPEIKGTHCWGAARWLTPTKALIQLSLRYKSDDHVWFSFFHEAAHLLLHGKKETFITSDEFTDASEEEADEFAESFLIPRHYDQQLRSLTVSGIVGFARELGIAPGIVVGRMQKEKLIGWNSQANALKRGVDFASEG